jgi:hypothetical protein
MKKPIKILAIVLACILALAACTVALKFAKDKADDKPSQTNKPSDEPENYILSGAYVFNDVIRCDTNISEEVFFVINKQTFTKMSCYVENEKVQRLVGDYAYWDQDLFDTVYSSSELFSEGKLSYCGASEIVFFEQEVSKEFYNFIKTNAVPRSYEMITFTISYDITGGEYTETISCPGGMKWSDFISSGYDFSCLLDASSMYLYDTAFSLEKVNGVSNCVTLYEHHLICQNDNAIVNLNDFIKDGVVYIAY